MKIYYLSHTEPDDGNIEIGPYFLTRPDAEKAAEYLEQLHENKKYRLFFHVGETWLWSDADDFIKS